MDRLGKGTRQPRKKQGLTCVKERERGHSCPGLEEHGGPNGDVSPAPAQRQSWSRWRGQPLVSGAPGSPLSVALGLSSCPLICKGNCGEQIPSIWPLRLCCSPVGLRSSD